MLTKFPLTLHYGFEGRIIILQKFHTDGDYKMTQKVWEHCNLLSQDDAHANRKSPLKSVQIAGGEVLLQGPVEFPICALTLPLATPVW